MFRICWGAGPSSLVEALQICSQLSQFSKCPRHGFFDIADAVPLEAETRAVQVVQAFFYSLIGLD